MNGDQIASLAYLGLLGAVVAGWFFVSNRDSLGRTAQMAAVWGFIFLGVIAAYGLWSDISRQIAPRQSIMADGGIEVPRGPDGHYHLTLRINGTPVDFIVDTGATQLVLSRRDAQRVGIDPDGLAYMGNAQTANGVVRTAPVRLDRVELGGVIDTDLRAVVNEGEMDGSLLGMGYLGLFERIEIANDRLLLTR